MVAIGAFSRMAASARPLPDYDRAMAVDRDAIERARELIDGRLHRTPMLSSKALGPNVYPQGRALPEDGLVQATRDGEQGRVPVEGGERAWDRDLVRGERGAGRGVRRSRGGHPVHGLHVGDGESDQGRGDARLRRRGRPQPQAIRPRRTSACSPTSRRPGARSSIPSTIPCSRRATERWGSRSSRTSPTSRPSSSRFGGGGLIAGVASAVDCRVVGVEPERRAVALRRDRGGRARAHRAELDRRRPERPVHRRRARSPCVANASTRSCS